MTTDKPRSIVTYAHRYKRPPRKKPGKAVAIAIPAIVKAPTKGERARRREAAAADDADRERSPEELEDEARAAALIARMMRPR
jgi:hypothetical protein